MTYNRKTTAEDLGIMGIVIGCFGLILLLIGLIFYPIVWIGLMLFLTSLALIICGVLFRNRL